MELTVVSIDLQCRICLDIQESEDDMTSLFEMMDGDFTLSDILTNISNIEVEANENIPSNVCGSCLATIINFHNLLLQFQETEQFFKKNYIDSLNNKVVDKDYIVHSPMNDNLEQHEKYNGSETVLENESEEVYDSSVTETESEKNDETNSESTVKYLESDTNCKQSKSKKIYTNFVTNRDEGKNNEIFLTSNTEEIQVEGHENLEDKSDSGFYETITSEKFVKNPKEAIKESLKNFGGDSVLYKPQFNQHILQNENTHVNENVFLKINKKEIELESQYLGDTKDPGIYETITSDKLVEETPNEIITESLKYSCRECGDTFLYKPGFNQHMLQKHNKHLNEKDYTKYSSKIIIRQPKMFPELIKLPKIGLSKIHHQCRVCKECFENESELKEHLNIHKTHICPVCGLAFLKKYYLTDHLVVHSTDRNYICHICNASFKHRNALTAHKNCHKTFRDQTCETCGHSFKDKGTLKVHIKLKHNDDRNHACPECPLTFKLKSFLDKHFIRKHTKRTKDFVCSDCGVAYLNKTTLMRHMSEKHSGKSPQHICAVCGKFFSARLTLKKHLQSIHKINMTK